MRRDCSRAAIAALALLGLLLLPLLARSAAAAEPSFPALSGRIVDEANLLDPQQEQRLAAELQALEEKSSDQLVVVTLPSLQGYPIEDYGYRLGRHWGIGTAKLDNGVLLIVAPNERKVRIEVGYGLEGTLTDAMSRIIIENAILPRFRAGDFAGGIQDGVRDIVLTLTGNAAEVAERARALERRSAEPETDWVMVVFWTLIILLVIYNVYSGGGPGYRGRRGGPMIFPGGGWGGGSRGGGGGGFSGGGGGFGGGGASGSW